MLFQSLASPSHSRSIDRSILRFWFYFYLFGIVLFSFSASAQKFQIYGTVTDAQNNQPIKDTWIGLYNSERLLQQGWTNAEGQYRLSPHEGDLGQYWLEIRPEDDRYANTRQPVDIPAWDLIEVPILLGRLQEGGTFVVEGYVREVKSEKSIRGAWLGLYQEKEILNYQASDADGHYSLSAQGLEGTYRIEVKPVRSPHQEMEELLEVKPPELIQRDFYLSPLPSNVSSSTPEVYLEVQGRLVP